MLEGDERFDVVVADGIYALPATDGVALLSSQGFVGSKPPADALAEGAQVRATSWKHAERKQHGSERASERGSCLSGRTLDAAPAASVKPATPALHPLLPRPRRGEARRGEAKPPTHRENTAAAAAAAAIRYVLSRERARKQPGAAKFPPLGASRL